MGRGRFMEKEILNITMMDGKDVLANCQFKRDKIRTLWAIDLLKDLFDPKLDHIGIVPDLPFNGGHGVTMRASGKYDPKLDRFLLEAIRRFEWIGAAFDKDESYRAQKSGMLKGISYNIQQYEDGGLITVTVEGLQGAKLFQTNQITIDLKARRVMLFDAYKRYGSIQTYLDIGPKCKELNLPTITTSFSRFHIQDIGKIKEIIRDTKNSGIICEHEDSRGVFIWN